MTDTKQPEPPKQPEPKKPGRWKRFGEGLAEFIATVLMSGRGGA